MYFDFCTCLSGPVAKQSGCLNGGFENGLEGLPTSVERLRVDHRADSLPSPRPPVAAANLRLAELRSVSEFPGVAALSRLLDRENRGTSTFGDSRALAADQTGRATVGERRVSAALKGGLRR